jgi:peptidoglycan/xylan/chitin deacetylase (PgdA/CDA1 family)
LLAAGGCGGEPPDESDQVELSQAATVTNPELPFSGRPSYLPAKTAVLTFDDGPDGADNGSNTAKVLDILKRNGIKASFFINTSNYTDVANDTTAQAVVKRIVNEGHDLCNHTVDHPNLTSLSNAAVEKEIAGVESLVRKLLPGRRLTLFRAPFGEPYDPDGGNRSAKSRIAPIVGKHAVHVGWDITPQDAGGCSTSSCVLNAIKSAVNAGDYGIILMHATQPHTTAALQNIINFLKGKGFTFKTAEDAVKARFGKSSAALIP